MFGIHLEIIRTTSVFYSTPVCGANHLMAITSRTASRTSILFFILINNLTELSDIYRSLLINCTFLHIEKTFSQGKKLLALTAQLKTKELENLV